MRLLVALGGNAIKRAHEKGSSDEQFANCKVTTRLLAEIVMHMKKDDRLIITHGNGPQSVVFDEAENRLHVQKAVMSLIMR